MMWRMDKNGRIRFPGAMELAFSLGFDLKRKPPDV